MKDTINEQAHKIIDHQLVHYSAAELLDQLDLLDDLIQGGCDLLDLENTDDLQEEIIVLLEDALVIDQKELED